MLQASLCEVMSSPWLARGSNPTDMLGCGPSSGSLLIPWYEAGPWHGSQLRWLLWDVGAALDVVSSSGGCISGSAFVGLLWA